MKALVGVKRVLDYSIKVRVNPQKTAVDLQGLKMSMNPFDEIAVEEALRLREAGKIKEVVALTIGDKKYAKKAIPLNPYLLVLLKCSEVPLHLVQIQAFTS